jgi:hypothetical protein
MEWQHKGITFTITLKPMGPLVMASAKAPASGMFIRIRPFSAIGRSEEEAVRLLHSQIEMEYRKIPDMSIAG